MKRKLCPDCGKQLKCVEQGNMQFPHHSVKRMKKLNKANGDFRSKRERVIFNHLRDNPTHFGITVRCQNTQCAVGDYTFLGKNRAVATRGLNKWVG